jgi:transcriptional regulator with XRE-family HTH domain
METLKERLEYFLKSKRISKAEFGRSIGVSAAFVTSIRKSIQPDKIEAIKAAYPNFNITWLLTGEGDMMVSDVGAAPSAASPAYGGQRLQGGSAAGFSQERAEVVGSVLLPGLPVGPDVPYFQVRGDSMVCHADPSKSIPAGAWVGVRAHQSQSIRWGEVYAFNTLDGPMVKKLLPSDKGDDYIKCVSYNIEEGFHPFDLPKNEIIGVLYDVVAVVYWKAV